MTVLFVAKSGTTVGRTGLSLRRTAGNRGHKGTYTLFLEIPCAYAPIVHSGQLLDGTCQAPDSQRTGWSLPLDERLCPAESRVASPDVWVASLKVRVGRRRFARSQRRHARNRELRAPCCPQGGNGGNQVRVPLVDKSCVQVVASAACARGLPGSRECLRQRQPPGGDAAVHLSDLFQRLRTETSQTTHRRTLKAWAAEQVAKRHALAQSAIVRRSIERRIKPQRRGYACRIRLIERFRAGVAGLAQHRRMRRRDRATASQVHRMPR